MRGQNLPFGVTQPLLVGDHGVSDLVGAAPHNAPVGVIDEGAHEPTGIPVGSPVQAQSPANTPTLPIRRLSG